MQIRNLTPAALILAAVALVGCSPAAESDAAPSPTKSAAAAPAAAPTPTSSPVEVPADPCPWPRPSISLVQDGTKSGHGYNPDGGRITGELSGEIVDLGPRTYAEGTVQVNDAGEIVSYTVAPGDVYETIYGRFCFSDFYDVYTYNSGIEPQVSRGPSWAIQPGDVLVLRPDPTVEWKPQR